MFLKDGSWTGGSCEGLPKEAFSLADAVTRGACEFSFTVGPDDSPSPSAKRHAFVLVGLLLVSGLADWITSYEISVGPLYLLAVFHAAWHFGWR